MAVNIKCEKVDSVISKESRWQPEFMRLREIALECGLSEDLKWGCPTYDFENGNVFLIHGFKEYCALLFFKGSLMTDKENLLIQQTEKVQARRQLRFKSVEEINEKAEIIKAYILEAIAIEHAGLKPEMKPVKQVEIFEELQAKFDENPQFQTAFESLTPGRQKAYIYFFTGAKQSKTKTARIEKYMEKIFENKGLND